MSDVSFVVNHRHLYRIFQTVETNNRKHSGKNIIEKIINVKIDRPYKQRNVGCSAIERCTNQTVYFVRRAEQLNAIYCGPLSA